MNSKKYESLSELLRETASKPGHGLETDMESIFHYQDLIGHSTIEDLREHSNNEDLKEDFYRVYGLAYGTVAAIRYYVKNSEKIQDLLDRVDYLEADVADAEDKLKEANEKYKNLAEDHVKLFSESERAKAENEKLREENIRLKARMFDMMEGEQRA